MAVSIPRSPPQADDVGISASTPTKALGQCSADTGCYRNKGFLHWTDEMSGIATLRSQWNLFQIPLAPPSLKGET